MTPADQDDVEVIEEKHDAIVLTQTCDMINDKVEDILVAVVLSYDGLVQQFGAAQAHIKGKQFRKAAVDGNLPPYALLQERLDEPSIPWSLVNFHHLFTLPKSLASRVADERGDRLRLVPPYKEHLAQAFARYMMRVGLPSTLEAFESRSPGSAGVP
ncbi:MAG: hypothetical protein ACOH2F_15730 [Cellulomonas sp.]